MRTLYTDRDVYCLPMHVQLESTVDQLKKELAAAKSAAVAQEANLKRQVAAFKAEQNAKFDTVKYCELCSLHSKDTSNQMQPVFNCEELYFELRVGV